jgi:hypothetical protein
MTGLQFSEESPKELAPCSLPVGVKTDSGNDTPGESL